MNTPWLHRENFTLVQGLDTMLQPLFSTSFLSHNPTIPHCFCQWLRLQHLMAGWWMTNWKAWKARHDSLYSSRDLNKELYPSQANLLGDSKFILWATNMVEQTWSWTLLERPLDSFPAFHGARSFSTKFTSYPPVHITPSHLHLGLPSDLFLSGFPTNNLYAFLFSPICATLSAHLILLDLIILIMSKQLHYRPDAHKGHFSNTATIWPQNICWQCHLIMKQTV
jgi:hypothetical protein